MSFRKSATGHKDAMRPFFMRAAFWLASFLIPRPTRVEPPYAKLFIVGCPRSGTTWLRQIFDSHPAAVAGRESHLYSNLYAWLARRDIRDGETWARVLLKFREAIKRREGLEGYLNFFELIPLVVDTYRQCRQGNVLNTSDAIGYLTRLILDHWFMRTATSETVLLVEKTPYHVKYAAQILGYFPESKVLVVVRDGRDVCVSLQMLSKTQSWPPKERPGQIDCWKDHVADGLIVEEDPRFTDRVLRVHYEDLLSAPKEKIAEMFRFAGLPAGEQQVERTVKQTAFSSYSDTGPGQYRRKGKAGDWVNHFSQEDLDLFCAEAGELSRRLGYEL